VELKVECGAFDCAAPGSLRVVEKIGLSWVHKANQWFLSLIA